MKKSKIVLGWDEIETRKQKKRLVDAVISEINLLKKSSALKDILNDEGITIAELNRGYDVEKSGFYTLRMLKTGQIVEDHSYMQSDGYFSDRRYDEDISIPKFALPAKIEFYKITPKDIREIRKEINR